MPATLRRYERMSFHEPTCGAEVFRAKMRALLGQDSGLLEDEQVCFTSLQELLENPQKKINPHSYSLKTLQVFCLAQENQREKTGKTFCDYSLNWTKSGTMRSGKLLTVPTWFPKGAKESSLLDIIEHEVHERYFLSDEQRDRLINQWLEQVKATKEPTGELHQIIGGMQGQRVYAVSGKAPTLAANGGGQGAKTGLYMFVDLSKIFKVTDKARCILERYNKGISNRSGESSGVMLVGNVNPSGKGQNGNVYLADGLSPTLTTNKGEGIKVAVIQKPRGNSKGGLHDISPTITSNSWQHNNFLAIPCLTPTRGEKRQNGRRFKLHNDDMFTITASEVHGLLLAYADSILIRRLTPLECFRLQGFTDEQFYKAQSAIVNNKPISDSQLYKMAGNAVTVDMVAAIAGE